MAPCRVSTPAKGAPVASGMTGRTPDLVVVRRTGGGGTPLVISATIDADCAEAKAAKPAVRMKLCMVMDSVYV